jgi:hypothetical protein
MLIQNYLDGFCSVVEDKWGTSRPSMFINCWPEDGKASKCIGGDCCLSVEDESIFNFTMLYY